MSDRRGYLALDDQSKVALQDACLLLEHLESMASQLRGTGRGLSNFQSSIDRLQADFEILIRQDQRTRRSILNDDIKKFARPEDGIRALPSEPMSLLGQPLSTPECVARG